MSARRSQQTDRFVHDRLPAKEAWPDILPLPGMLLDGPLNCVSFLLDRHLESETAHRPAIRSDARVWTYAELGGHVSRIAQLMVEDFGVEPGNRVLIRGANSPEVAAVWLAIQKIGAVAVTTMSLLRTAELQVIIEMAKPALAFCEDALAGELRAAVGSVETDLPIVGYGAESGELYRRIAGREGLSGTFAAQADDVSLIAFTSGTTGRPKATVHFHRDVLAICETMSRHIVSPRPEDVFIGTSPLAFTFGLGGLLVFPLHAGACTVLNPRYLPEELLDAIDHYEATVCFTVPTFFQQMLAQERLGVLARLRLAVSSGEALPLPTRQAWLAATGDELAEVIGATEMLHAFAGANGSGIRPGFIGPAIPGFELSIRDDDGNPLPPDQIGRLAVKGPTGCRYLDDPRQGDYVQNGWNITGDACSMSDDGYIAYHTRYDDMIISSGYNISGLEVENVLLKHPEVAECAVVGEADEKRGQITVAHVVLRNGCDDLDGMADRLKDHVKAVIAPYKYPRRISFCDRLPRNESGKIQRFRLR